MVYGKVSDFETLKKCSYSPFNSYVNGSPLYFAKKILLQAVLGHLQIT